MNIFEQATRQAFRFETSKGNLAVEDLWNLPLTSDTGRANLDDIAKGLQAKLTSAALSFVTDTTPVNKVYQAQFDIVLHIINTKLAEVKAAEQYRLAREKKQKIMAIIEQKQDAALSSASLEDLEAMLNSL
jgi:hypothetical protein